MFKNMAETKEETPIWQKVEFKPQLWHVEVSGPNGEHREVVGAFRSREVADEVRDEENRANENFPYIAYSCLCDCPNRECQYAS